MEKRKMTPGFTLIELLVVIAIIGLLSTISLIALNTARARARDARRLADIKQIQTALALYYDDAEAYPSSLSSGSSISYNGNDFMKAVPAAPTPADGTCTSGNNQYAYSSQSANSSYTITYCLGIGTSEISAGINTATPAGIK